MYFEALLLAILSSFAVRVLLKASEWQTRSNALTLFAGKGFWGMKTSRCMIIPRRVHLHAEVTGQPGAIIVLTLIGQTSPATVAIDGQLLRKVG
jgi:hypothetical protein